MYRLIRERIKKDDNDFGAQEQGSTKKEKHQEM